MRTNDHTPFAAALLPWFERHGRKDLPWQQNPTPYRVWVSEIMLQQTQVTTVIPYYQAFMQRFPGVADLAKAGLDDVLLHWQGLGYYARARNLHKAAKLICDHYAGEFPQDFEQVLALPGIGRSTAGAILTLACQQHHAILDGNVKRVLSRYFAVEGWPGQPKVAERLWAYAEQLTPPQRCSDYTQALMDLGATLCRRSRPQCAHCPVQPGCQAYQLNQVEQFPFSKPKKEKPVKQTLMLMITNQHGDYLMQRRPPTGIWGGLLSFPELTAQQDPAQWAQEAIGQIQIKDTWDSFRHTFSHFHLEIKPVLAHLQRPADQVREDDSWVWYNTRSPSGGLATPAKKLIERNEQLITAN